MGEKTIFGTVEAVKTVSDLFMPVSGRIIEINAHIEKSPELVNKDPYGSWIIKLLLDEIPEREHLLTADQYKRSVSGS